MRPSWRRWAAALLLGAAVAAPAAAQGATAALPGVVVWDFENQTPSALARSGADATDWLGRSLGEALTARLLEAPGLAVVERQRLRDVLAEQKLGAGDLADEATRLRLGRVVGAGRMVFGSFFALGGQVQVTVRVVDSATSRVTFSDELAAPQADVMTRAEALNQRLVRHLGGGAATSAAYPAALWQAYDAALALSDAGRHDEAVAALRRLLEQNKDFTPAERQLVALLDKMSRR
jgi:curli biogenesis system outer membrane secretion channel CsgG